MKAVGGSTDYGERGIAKLPALGWWIVTIEGNVFCRRARWLDSTFGRISFTPFAA